MAVYVEVITRYELGEPTTYSFDKGETWITKAEYKKKIGAMKRPLYNNSKIKEK